RFAVDGRGAVFELGELVAKLNYDALGGLAADAGNARQFREVVAADGGYHLVGAHSREHRDARFGTDALNGDQAQVKLSFAVGFETKKLYCVFADMRVDPQPHVRADIAELKEGRKRYRDVVPHAADVDNDGIC